MVAVRGWPGAAGPRGPAPSELKNVSVLTWPELRCLPLLCDEKGREEAERLSGTCPREAAACLQVWPEEVTTRRTSFNRADCEIAELLRNSQRPR